MDEYCYDCKTATELVYDHSSGDTICSECGLVLESHSIDDTSEWRTFANDSTDDHDPIRVGSPTNPLLADAPLTTLISSNPTSHLLLPSPPIDRRVAAFSKIDTMAERLGLFKAIKDLAKDIFDKVSKSKLNKGGKHQDAILAACLYVACRKENHPRTHKEICSVVNVAKKREITREVDSIVRQFKFDMGTIDGGDFMRRFCSNLGMDNRFFKVVEEAMENVKVVDIRRSPVSVAATVVYVVAAQVSGGGGDDDKKALFRDVSRATGVSELTIKEVYKDLRPHISKIIPVQIGVEGGFQIG